MASSDYRSGASGIFFYGPETATYPSGNAIPSPAMPTNAFWGGSFMNVPNSSIDDGSQEKYGLGSNAAQAIVPGARVIAQDLTFMLANKVLLQKCFFGSGGYRNLADLCLYDGNSNEFGDGTSHAIRFAKCNSGSISFSEGGGTDISVSAQFWGLAEEDAAPVTPSPSDLLLYGTPLNWHNVTNVSIGGVNVRDTLASLTLSWNHNLERKGFRPDYGTASPWSRTAYALLPRQRSYRLEMSFHTPDVAAAVLGLAGSATGTGAISIVVDDTGSSIQGTSPRVFTFASAGGRIASRTRRGGTAAEELMGNVTIISSNLTVT